MKRKLYAYLEILLSLLCQSPSSLSFVTNAKSFHDKLPTSQPSIQHPQTTDNYNSIIVNITRARRNDEPVDTCEACQVTSYDIPFYCAIKSDLPQCIFPKCPKFCDDIGGDPSIRPKSKPTSAPKRPQFPHPVNLPRVPDDRVEEFILYSKPKSTSSKMEGEAVVQQVQNVEAFDPYDPNTCEFSSPHLRRIRPGSKYIEYRPENQSYQISDIYQIADKFGLAMAEFRHPMEWYSVQKSSIMESVSTYKLTAAQPRRFYAVGLSDNEDEQILGKFLYKSDHSNPTFAVFDPRIYGRVDEKCGVLSHVLGSDKRQHLITRFWNCDKYLGDGKRVAHGLLMFPPGSLCYQRSEEECGKLKQEEAGGDATYHSMIQIGQTLTRFLYLYTDQRSWEDALETCKAKGLRMLDFDLHWGDALRTAEVIGHFLQEAKLNPVTSFWTSGRFQNDFTDGKFFWATTNNMFEIQYQDEAPPFAYSWWDDQDVTPEEKELSRRGKMRQPCVSLALNPETGGDRPKLNFKAWYCDFPMYVLCYKELNATDSPDNPIPPPKTATRSPPDPESCQKSPESGQAGATEGQTDNGVNPNPKVEEEIDPFNEATCTSNSLTVRRLTPNSKFVDYQPKHVFYSVAQIKEQCRKYGLLPAEIRTKEDWDSVEKSGIGGVISGEGDVSGTDYFYVIGMDDSKEQGKLRYDSGDNLTFSMFNADDIHDIGDQCAILESVAVPRDGTRGLMMLHANCDKGLLSAEKVAYGLCMFPRTWKCYAESTEETATAADMRKYTTIIPLGSTSTRSIFFNPVQRNWEDAMKFSEAAKLSVLNFDPKWGDTAEVLKIFKENLVKNGGFFQLTPFWTSGKLDGFYKDENGTGSWESTKAPLQFKDVSNIHWLHLKKPYLPTSREGTIENGCVEVTFEDSLARLRPYYCDTPKYFLMYRKSKKRKDPPPVNTLGITVIETGARQAAPSQIPPDMRPTSGSLSKPVANGYQANRDKPLEDLQTKREIGNNSITLSDEEYYTESYNGSYEEDSSLQEETSTVSSLTNVKVKVDENSTKSHTNASSVSPSVVQISGDNEEYYDDEYYYEESERKVSEEEEEEDDSNVHSAVTIR